MGMRGAIERNRRLKFDEEHDAKRVRLTQRVRSTNATREKQRDAHREHARCICCTRHLPLISTVEYDMPGGISAWFSKVSVYVCPTAGDPASSFGSEEKNPYFLTQWRDEC